MGIENWASALLRLVAYTTACTTIQQWWYQFICLPMCTS